MYAIRASVASELPGADQRLDARDRQRLHRLLGSRAPGSPASSRRSASRGRATWRGSPRPCFQGSDAGNYAKKHDPFVYYRAIVTQPGACATGRPAHPAGGRRALGTPAGVRLDHAEPVSRHARLRSRRRATASCRRRSHRCCAHSARGACSSSPGTRARATTAAAGWPPGATSSRSWRDRWPSPARSCARRPITTRCCRRSRTCWGSRDSPERRARARRRWRRCCARGA